MARVVYNLLLALLSPLLLVYLFWRLAKGKEDKNHWGERWGRLPESVARDPRRPRFWVHTVSIGELMAAVPILRELRRRFPDALILVSTITPGGREVALKQVPPADEVVYFPLDFPFAARRALDAARPDAVVLLEWEIWPNFLVHAERRGAKIAVLNGRVSDRGLRRGRRGSFFTRPGLDAVGLFAMQSDEDARRAALVGADPAKVVTLGNTKFDEAVTPASADERARLRADLGIAPNVPVLVCGSTRPGEEEILADAFGRARHAFPDLHLIIAPRHIERTDDIEAELRAAGWENRRRSQRQGKALRSREVVLLLDTFGELARVYAVAEVAFVGGSLLPFGGQSVFQPLAQGVPTLFGPHMNNQRDIAALAKTEGVGFEAQDAQSLADEVVRLLSLPEDEKRALGRKARALIERNQGVAARCVDAVERLMGSAT
jgi:3-deoxy-D-manno-octulosonic-acid transferase